MASERVKINRAPVLTLWATVVAERLGYDHDTALTLGKSVAGLNAQSKGRRLGIYEEPTDQEEQASKKARPAEEPKRVSIVGRAVPVVETDQGIRALDDGKPMDPAGVSRYLEKKFGENLAGVQEAMRVLANSYQPQELEAEAFGLYEKFRPAIPEGKRGWGAAGELDLDTIRSLAK